MRLHRFIGEYDLAQKEVKITDLDIINQIKNVLRLSLGDKIILSNGKGEEAETIIKNISKDEILCKIESKLALKEPNKKVNLYLAILKKENFEYAVQKAVETGVATITPIITERTVKTGLNISRLEKIIKEASEQSGRSLVPTLFPIVDFKQALIDGNKSDEKIIFHLENKNYTPDENATNASIFVGPEGGFTDQEIEFAKVEGYTVASLGHLTLRGETAAIIATYRVIYSI
jgi:16S rRNA (uracil1498-N3)-methyltransferase